MLTRLHGLQTNPRDFSQPCFQKIFLTSRNLELLNHGIVSWFTFQIMLFVVLFCKFFLICHASFPSPSLFPSLLFLIDDKFHLFSHILCRSLCCSLFRFICVCSFCRLPGLLIYFYFFVFFVFC